MADITCSFVVDYDDKTDHEITCGASAVFLCSGEPRCAQCVDYWLDDLAPGHDHTIRVIPQEEPKESEVAGGK